MNANELPKTILADLGYLSMAKVRFGARTGFRPELTIVQAAYADEGVSEPAYSISLSSWESLESLHDLLTEALKNKPAA